jgi:hypothetical protein
MINRLIVTQVPNIINTNNVSCGRVELITAGCERREEENKEKKKLPV